MTPEALLKPAQVCQFLSISRRTLNRLTAEGTLSSLMIRRSVRFTRDQLDQFLERSARVAD